MNPLKDFFVTVKTILKRSCKVRDDFHSIRNSTTSDSTSKLFFKIPENVNHDPREEREKDFRKISYGGLKWFEGSTVFETVFKHIFHEFTKQKLGRPPTNPIWTSLMIRRVNYKQKLHNNLQINFVKTNTYLHISLIITEVSVSIEGSN